MAITAKQVNELRQITGAGMMDCKKALVETDGNIEAAIDLLRKKGQKMAAKRADKDANEGSVFAYTSEDGKEGVAFSLNCETEPVSNTDGFRELGKNILDLAISNKPENVESLMALDLNGKPVSENITEFVGTIGEKIEVSNYALAQGEKVVAYLHGNKIAVLVNLSNVGDAEVTEAGKDIGMQIAAMNPVAVDENSVDPAVVEREKQIGIEKAREEGKPENILERIAQGFVKKYYKDNTLLNQEFVKNPKQSVKDYLNSVQKGLTVTSFDRVSIGR